MIETLSLLISVENIVSRICYDEYTFARRQNKLTINTQKIKSVP